MMQFSSFSSLALLSLSFTALSTAHIVPRSAQLPNDLAYDLVKAILPQQFHDMPTSALKDLLPADFAEKTTVSPEVLKAIAGNSNSRQLNLADSSPQPPADPYFGQALMEVFSNVWSGSYDSAPIGKWFAGMLPVQRFAKKVAMKPQFRKDARRYLALYGPIELVAKEAKKPFPANNMFSLDPFGQAFIKVMDEGFPKNATILAGRPGLLDAETLTPVGPLEGVYIHHVITQDLTKPQVQPVTVCETDGAEEDTTNKLVNRFRTMAGSGFIGQGDDNGGSPIMFTAKNKNDTGYFNSGFLTGMNDKYVLYADLVNYTNSTRKVYMMFDIEYMDGHNHGGEAISTLISVSGCDLLREPETDPNGPKETKSRNFPILQDSKIISAKGHMHDGGVAMVLYINDKKVCSSDAKYSDGGSANDQTITEMTYCPDVINVKKGDVMQMSSIYDMKAHPLRASTSEEGGHAAMGTMGGKDLMGMMAIVWAIDPKLTESRVW